MIKNNRIFLIRLALKHAFKDYANKKCRNDYTLQISRLFNLSTWRISIIPLISGISCLVEMNNES